MVAPLLLSGPLVRLAIALVAGVILFTVVDVGGIIDTIVYELEQAIAAILNPF